MGLLLLLEETDPHLINNQALPSRSPEQLPRSHWSQESGGSWEKAQKGREGPSEGKNLPLSATTTTKKIKSCWSGSGELKL